MRRPPWLIALVAGIMLASSLEAYSFGIAFDSSSLGWFWQFLDEQLLRTDLVRSVWYLHGQPPLFNLFVGAVLKLPAGLTVPAFAASYQALLALLIISSAWLMRRLGVPMWLVAAACTVFALQPTSVLYSRWLFYTLPIAALVTAAGAALGRFVDGGERVWARTFAVLTTLLMLTRPAFHPLWFVMAVGLVSWRLDPARRRMLLRVAIVPLVLVNLWFLKNWWQVGTYGSSSWLGMNLRRGWELPAAEVEQLVRSGTVPPVWAAKPFLPAVAYQRYGYFDPSAPPAGHPALDALRKANGERNLHHRDYARLSRAMLAGDVAVMRAHPRLYLERVESAFWLFLQPGPLILFGNVDAMPAAAFRDGVNRILYLAAPVGMRGTAGASLNLLVLAFPVALAYGAWLAWRAGTHDRGAAAVATYIVATVVWFTIVVNLVEIGENDRMRWEIDALVLVLLASAAATGGRGLRRWMRAAPRRSRG